MRDYEITVAQSRLAYGQVTWLVTMVKNWRMRKTLKHLHSFSDYQLRDIGLTRGDLQRLITMPLNCDYDVENERRALISARHYRNSTAALALPNLGRAALPTSEQPTRNLGGVVHIGLAKKPDVITLLSTQNC